MIVKNDLYDYSNRMIFQQSEGFKFSVDSILLAEYANNLKDNYKVLDMCSGNAVVPLIMSKYSKAHFVSFEIQKEIFDLGVKSIEYNNLKDQIDIYNDNILNIKNYFEQDTFDVVVCNPPFFKVTSDKGLNIDERKQIARHEVYITLEDIFKVASSVLKDNGIMYMVHRCDRIDEIIINANKYNMNVKNMQLVSTKEGSNPSIVLVKCVKNSKMGMKVNLPISLDQYKTYQNMFKE